MQCSANVMFIVHLQLFVCVCVLKSICEFLTEKKMHF